MSLGIPSAILASIVSLTVAVTILLRRPRRPLYTRFAWFTLALFVWHATAVASRFGGGFTSRLQVAAGLIIAPTSLMFFAEIVRDHSAQSRTVARLAFAIGSVLMALNLSPWGDHLASQWLATLYVVGALGLVLHTLFERYRGAKADTERKRLLYLMGGGLTATALGMGELAHGHEVLAATGHIATTFYVYFLYQSLVSRRVIDMVELLGKAAVLGVLTLVLATVYALMVVWVGTEQQGLWLFNTLVASFVILILYDQVRPWIEETTAKLIFQRRYELRVVVRRLLRALRTTISIDEMASQVLDALHASGRASQASLFLPVEGEVAFELASFRGTKPSQSLSLTQQPTLLSELRRDRRPVLLENLVDRYQDVPTSLTEGDATAQRDQDRIGEAIATMRALGANIVLPIVQEERILGILTLGTEIPTEGYSLDEIASLLSVAEACAVVIENSQEYERLRERDRLVVMGEMATGIAHEIRNPLGAIKGAAQCLDPESMPADSRDLVRVIIEETDRLNRVLGQFLEYARPFRASPVPTDINAVVEATLRLLATDRIPAAVAVKPELAKGLSKVSIDPEQLKQVLINLVQNAVQAMPAGGEISIVTSASKETTGELGDPTAPLSAHALVRVRDTGQGIKPEDLPRIFMPFFTTKPQGTGLGLAICNRIVRSSGGTIEVSSKLGRGTTITLRLPLADASTSAHATHKGR
ncbi:MAG: GAF domain-containing protein [Deltaproteobacteria bacterium]|nr:GAF domain-containing protein [Deltaproteobacteria bacterium]